MHSFKQFLTELMIDLDPEKSPSDTFQDIRKTQLMAQRSPQRVIRQQTMAAKDQQQAAMKSTNNATKNIEVQIARKKQELFRLEQQLANARQANPTPPTTPGAT